MMSVINKWFIANSLEINFNKTTCIPFSIPKANMFNVYECIKIHDSNCIGCLTINTICNCTSLKSADSVNYLGIVFDGFLKWNLHINELIKKVICMYSKFKVLIVDSYYQTQCV